MNDAVKVVVLLRLATELAALIERALDAGRTEVSAEELDAVFERADAAEAGWHEALLKDEERKAKDPV
ncbi:MAG: hypothetical protein ACOC7T_01240 [Planctomycetota bacterium]